MRSILLFIYRYHILLSFILLEVISLSLLTQNRSYQSTALWKATTQTTGRLYSALDNWREYFHLRESNTLLVTDNAQLHSRLENAKFDNFIQNSIQKDSLLEQQFEFFGGKVVNATYNKRNNYITINRGKKHGVKPRMGVFDPNGVVGITKTVSDHYSVVLPLLHRDVMISAKLLNAEYFGILQWDGQDHQRAKLRDIPRHAVLLAGDTVVTNGFSSIFPEGIKLGVIEEAELIPGTNYYDITIKLSTDFTKLRYVYIIKNKMRLERDSLENASESSE